MTPASVVCFFFSSRRRHTRLSGDWSSDVCSSDLPGSYFGPRFGAQCPERGREEAGCRRVLASLYGEGPSEFHTGGAPALRPGAISAAASPPHHRRGFRPGRRLGRGLGRAAPRRRRRPFHRLVAGRGRRHVAALRRGPGAGAAVASPHRPAADAPRRSPGPGAAAMMDLILQIATALACAVVVMRAEPALNRMHRQTQLIVRLSFYQLAVSAGAELLAIGAFAYVPSWREMLLTSPVGLALIQTYEGYRATRYLCPAGKWTIGYGHVIGAAEWPRLDKARLSPEQAAALLVEDLAYCEDLIARHVTAPLAQLQFDAMASLLYNVGPGRLGARDGIIWLKTGQPSTLLAKLNGAG